MNWRWRIGEVTGKVWWLLHNWRDMLWVLFPKWAKRREKKFDDKNRQEMKRAGQWIEDGREKE